MTTTDYKPDLTDVITEGMSPSGAITEEAYDRLRRIAQDQPDYVAYFAAGGLELADEDGKPDVECIYAMLALLETPAGVKALQEALQDLVSAPGGEGKIGLHLSDAELMRDEDGKVVGWMIPGPDGKHYRVCTCGNDTPAQFTLEQPGMSPHDERWRCNVCGATTDSVGYRKLVADFEAARVEAAREGYALKLN